ncbi:glycosyltransferase family 4 protein [Akkermansiaceae bacterium]|nr:glycosyltransferase family 4 protein [Akkermansiaceae bacterium]
MKLAYLSNSVIPSTSANSVHVMKMCQGLASAKCDTSLYAHQGDDLESGNPYMYYGVDQTFKIRAAMIPSFPRGRHLAYAFWTNFLMAFDRPQIAYGRDVFACSLASRMGIKTMFELHTLPDRESKIWSTLKSLKVRKNFLGLCVITQALADSCVENLGFDRSKILVLPDGADPCVSVPPKPINRPDVLNIGYIGSLFPGKGMEMISCLAAEIKDAHFHIVGGNPEQIEAWKLRLGDNLDCVDFYGHIPHSETCAYARACDLLIAPYGRKVGHIGRGDISKYLSPLKLFEYMSVGKAILCSDLPVLREIMIDSKNCLLARPENVSDWLSKIYSLRDPSLRERLASEGNRVFLERYTWAARARRLTSWIETSL